MRIGWVTPFNQHSAIARSTLGIIQALKKQQHDVVVIRSETAELLASPKIESQIKTITWIDFIKKERGEQVLTSFVVARKKTFFERLKRKLAKEWQTWLHSSRRKNIISKILIKNSLFDKQKSFDIILVNLGNYLAYHEGAIEIMRLFPTIGIFHDWSIYGLFKEYQHNYPGRIKPGLIRHLYGQEAEQKINRMNETSFFEYSKEYPMTEWLARYLSGAVVHSNFCLPRVTQSCNGPATKISLAYPPLEKNQDSTINVNSPRFLIITLGIVNENKRISSVLRAIANVSRLKEAVEYRVVGPVLDREREKLELLAKKLGIRYFQMTDRVSDAELRAHIKAADLVCALRYPALEGASASVIETLCYGKAVIVSNTGFYAELPDEYVFKVNPEYEIQEIEKYLTYALEHPEIIKNMGERARQWANVEFSSEKYATTLVKFIEEVFTLQPVLRAGEKLQEDLKNLNLNEDDLAIKRIANTIKKLWGIEIISDDNDLTDEFADEKT